MRLQHVSIPVPAGGAERARAFYGELLGLEEREVLPELDSDRYIWYRAGGDLELHLMLQDGAGSQQGHFCLALEAGLDELRARLEAAGIAVRDGTRIAGRARFSCRDPFGNGLEIALLPAAPDRPCPTARP